MNIKGLHSSFIQFRSDNLQHEISFEDFRDTFTNEMGVHNGTYQNLFLYHRLQEAIEKDKTVFYPGTVWILDNRKHKIFVNDNPTLMGRFKWESLDPEVYKKLVIYSTTPQESFKASESKQKEIVYDLEKVFDPESFYALNPDLPRKKVKKKIYNRIVAPFNFLDDRFGARDFNEEDLAVMDEIHSEWVEHKLADERTFKMMFSANRYDRGIKMMYDSLNRDDFYAKVFTWEGRPIAIRQILVNGDRGYDIAFFSRFWDVPSQLINYINVWCMKDLLSNGIKTLNSGLASTSGMKMSKTHLPHSMLTSYKYNLG